MGWWNATEDGGSLVMEDTGLLWGDSVADVMGNALEKIFKIFNNETGRNPTKEELFGGVLFSARPLWEE